MWNGNIGILKAKGIKKQENKHFCIEGAMHVFCKIKILNVPKQEKT
jgi:hypothetical protein